MPETDLCARSRQLMKLVVSPIGRAAVRTRYEKLFGEEPAWAVSQREIVAAIVAREKELEAAAAPQAELQPANSTV